MATIEEVLTAHQIWELNTYIGGIECGCGATFDAGTNWREDHIKHVAQALTGDEGEGKLSEIREVLTWQEGPLTKLAAIQYIIDGKLPGEDSEPTA